MEKGIWMLLVFAMGINICFGMVWLITKGWKRWYLDAIGICCGNKYVFWYGLAYC